MNSRYGPTPIPMPDIVSHPRHLGRLSVQIRKAIAALRDRKVIVHGQSGGSGICHFGTLVPMTTGGFTEGIRGGIVYCGDKNFNVDPKGIDLETDGVWLVSLQLACESNRSDDNEIFLPGIATSSETNPATFWDLKAWSAGPPATQYDDNTNPEVIDGIGTIVIPLGKLTVADGAAIFENTDCGHVRVGQCAGILSHERL